MLSYRHAYHAGNHADVLKHVVLVELLRYLTQKPTPLWYIDTHAGAGLYEPAGNPVAEGEAGEGIARIWGAKDAPPMVAFYLQQVAAHNPSGQLRYYPGSPRIAADMLRAGDRLWLSELHSADHAALQAGFAKRDRRVQIDKADGFERLRALLPPTPRRGLVMVDPSYEVAADYRQVVSALGDALRRFATGVYALWYPVLNKREARELPGLLERTAGERWLHARLVVREPGAGGLYGSGIFIANPPYSLPGSLEASLPWLVERLGRGSAACYSIEASGARHNDSPGLPGRGVTGKSPR